MTSKLRKTQLFLWALAAGCILIAIAVVSYSFLQGPGAPATTTTADGATGSTFIKTEFSLVDHTGKPVTEKTYEGKWKLVFFGFTHCPDVCPTALNNVDRVLTELGGKADEIVPLFITIDPERDTPKAMAEYVAAFDKRIVGLTGSAQQVRDAARAFRAYYGRVEQKTAPGGYTMNHSAFVYLMAPDGRFVDHFRHEDKAEYVATRIKKAINK